MARRSRSDPSFERELEALPPALRWREWLRRVEALLFAAAEPVSRDVLAQVVGAACVIEDLIADLREDLRGRPYEVVAVAGGWQLRTRPSLAPVLRAAGFLAGPDGGPSQKDATLLLAIGHFQPITRARLGAFFGREISRDTLAYLKAKGWLGAGPRSPEPGAPVTYVTTQAFLREFGFNSLADLPGQDLFAAYWTDGEGEADLGPLLPQQEAEIEEKGTDYEK
ncbi:SMC-Scp complex subunit ScpB [Beijerinckia indica]|uniref:Chromosome segregation and condensation protein ScpB n=1 Tax=Beijerinckia indica subsp. indica (strain ATCC 9039 / DSM 1715 / NCIMB 8712) TaxID=395963 RepID=B2IKC8_BEII9|nr:SMC-Scp complex subunit ScpB [Beijerinckia indica]ACB96409.1 chromosome segregation and condensation protein ScpB [Beijerinckia indica subsp. indica ATCC 9039]